MNIRILYGLSIALTTAFFSSACIGQESAEKRIDATVETANQAAIFLSGAIEQEGTNQSTPNVIVDNNLVPYLSALYGTGFASTDGEYLAQSNEELQTYYDLGMTYKYIAETYLRKQLQLPEEQGIIIQTTAGSGDGYKNGFRSGDIVLLVDETPVDTQYDLVQALAANRGTQKSAKIKRDGKPMDLVVAMSELQTKPNTRLIIGVHVDEIDDLVKAQLNVESGVAVTSLVDDGPAKQVGLLVHDVITQINGKPINNLDDLKNIVESSKGETVTLDVVRASRKLTIKVDPKAVPVETVSDLAISRLLVGHRYLNPVTLRVEPTTIVHSATVEIQTTVNDSDELTVEQRIDRLIEQIADLQNQLKDLKQAAAK